MLRRRCLPRQRAGDGYGGRLRGGSSWSEPPGHCPSASPHLKGAGPGPSHSCPFLPSETGDTSRSLTREPRERPPELRLPQGASRFRDFVSASKVRSLATTPSRQLPPCRAASSPSPSEAKTSAAVTLSTCQRRLVLAGPRPRRRPYSCVFGGHSHTVAGRAPAPPLFKACDFTSCHPAEPAAAGDSPSLPVWDAPALLGPPAGGTAGLPCLLAGPGWASA